MIVQLVPMHGSHWNAVGYSETQVERHAHGLRKPQCRQLAGEGVRPTRSPRSAGHISLAEAQRYAKAIHQSLSVMPPRPKRERELSNPKTGSAKTDP